MTRQSVLNEIRSLDPIRDAHRIAYLIAAFEFPFDLVRALEFALYRTYAVPSIGKLLDSTGEFARRTQKRYDDTDLIVSEIIIHGADSERGRAALRRMNQQHGRYPISNDDMLYVLSTFMFEPIRWLDRFAYRRLIEQERLGWFHFWRGVGKHMNIAHIPEDYDEFERWNRSYEQTHFAYSDASRRTAEYTRDLMLSWLLPKALFPLASPFIYALLDEGLLRAFGFPKQPRALTWLVESALRLRNRAANLLPQRSKPFWRTQIKRSTYPNGWNIDDLGADRG